MKLTNLLPLAALGSAFVIPDEQVMNSLAKEPQRHHDSLLDKLPSKDDFVHEFENTFSKVAESTKNTFDDAIEKISGVKEEVSHRLEETFDSSSWLEGDMLDVDITGHGKHGHHGHHGKHGHHSEPNQTVYQVSLALCSHS